MNTNIVADPTPVPQGAPAPAGAPLPGALPGALDYRHRARRYAGWLQGLFYYGLLAFGVLFPLLGGLYAVMTG